MQKNTPLLLTGESVRLLSVRLRRCCVQSLYAPILAQPKIGWDWRSVAATVAASVAATIADSAATSVAATLSSSRAVSVSLTLTLPVLQRTGWSSPHTRYIHDMYSQICILFLVCHQLFVQRMSCTERPKYLTPPPPHIPFPSCWSSTAAQPRRWPASFPSWPLQPRARQQLLRSY